MTVIALAPEAPNTSEMIETAHDKARVTITGPTALKATQLISWSSGKDSASRLHLRRSMLAAHFGELREGVWMRPDNLAWTPGSDITGDVTVGTNFCAVCSVR